MVCVKVPPFSIAPLVTIKLPTVQAEVGVTPATLVLIISISFIVPGVPLKVIAPVPANFTIPAQLKPELPKLIVLSELGLKFKIPSLDTVPLFVKLPRILCCAVPPLKIPPAFILKATKVVQPTLGLTPAVLLIFKVAKSGVELEFNVGDTEPLKLITPVEVDVIAFNNRIVCADVPLKVVVPVLVSTPLLVKSPLTAALPVPAE